MKLHKNCEHESRDKQCRLCGKVATKVAKLELHKIKMHNKVSTRTLSCDSCGIVNENIVSLKAQRGWIHEGRYNKCRLCAKEVKVKLELGNHKIGIHVVEVPRERDEGNLYGRTQRKRKTIMGRKTTLSRPMKVAT